MSGQAAGGPAEARSVRRRPCTSRERREVPVDEAPVDDPMEEEEQIEAEIVAHLFRGAAPEAYRQAVAQQEALRAKEAALRREVAEGRAQVRRLRAFTDLLKTDVSGYTEQQTEEYRRELLRRSKECFGKYN